MKLVTAIAALCLLPTLRAQTASVLVRTDVECRWSIDGTPRGILKANGEVRIDLSPGEHRVEADPVAGGPHWEGSVKLQESDNKVVAIDLQSSIERAESQRLGYWTDPKTKLTWATADNGSGVSWSQASYYCRTLSLGGNKTWTLPSIEELHNLFGGAADVSGHHVTGPIKLTGWAWSSSAGNESGEQWALDFGDGGAASVVMGDSGLNRALCVRYPEK